MAPQGYNKKKDEKKLFKKLFFFCRYDWEKVNQEIQQN